MLVWCGLCPAASGRADHRGAVAYGMDHLDPAPVGRVVLEWFQDSCFQSMEELGTDLVPKRSDGDGPDPSSRHRQLFLGRFERVHYLAELEHLAEYEVTT